MRSAASVFLLLVGSLIILTSSFILWKRNDPSRLQFENIDIQEISSGTSDKKVSGIEIVEINIKLPVIEARKIGDRWETTSQGVSFLATSPLPGDLGNSILYGHNWGSILGNLYKAKPGNKIVIYFSDGSVSEFRIDSVKEVLPSDSSVLSAREDAVVTLYTCSGLFDQRRLVVAATLI